MKRVLLTTFLLSGIAATAQQPVQLFKADTTGEGLRKMEIINMQKSLLPEATYSHITPRGKVYKLPIDNMPCLVPDMKQVSRMPLAILPEGRMPNAFPKQRLLPGEKKKDK